MSVTSHYFDEGVRHGKESRDREVDELKARLKVAQSQVKTARKALRSIDPWRPDETEQQIDKVLRKLTAIARKA